VSTAVFAFEEDHAPAARLAAELAVPLHAIHLHRFPDGEALPTVAGGFATALVYRGLADPDGKLVSLLLAADALRRTGVRRLVLVAPYLPYLRQDQVFEPGQPLSRDVVGRLLAPPFERIVTVQPHLHRTANLATVYPGPEVTALSAAELFAQAIGAGADALVIGPDAESDPWAADVAGRLGRDHLTLHKVRQGDRKVALALPAGARVAGRRVVLVDDICASGGTLATAAEILRQAGVRSIDALVAHALYDAAAATRLRRAGIRQVVSTDSCHHPSNSLFLAGLLAGALREEIRS